MKKRAFSPPAALCLCLAAIAFVAALTAPRALPPEPLEPLVPDLNSAPPHELLLLPGVGPVRAAAIVHSRRTDGAFSDLDNLQRIKGIGPRTVAGLHGFATAGGP